MLNYIHSPISWLCTKLVKHKIASAKRQRRLGFFLILLVFVFQMAASSRNKCHLPTSWSVLKLKTKTNKQEKTLKFQTWHSTNDPFCSIYFSSTVLPPGIVLPFLSLSGKQTFFAIFTVPTTSLMHAFSARHFKDNSRNHTHGKFNCPQTSVRTTSCQNRTDMAAYSPRTVCIFFNFFFKFSNLDHVLQTVLGTMNASVPCFG